MNRFGARSLTPYLLLGLVLWVLVLRSGVHATLAGVILAFTIPLQRTPGRPDEEYGSLLHRLEHALHKPVGFFVVPVFGLANAGGPFIGLPAEAFSTPVTLGVGLGLLVGKLFGVMGFSMLAIRLGLADMPAHAGRLQLAGTALLCGIGFTMSLFITLLAFPGDALLQAQAKIGILAGSLVAGLLGYTLLRVAAKDRRGTPPR
jgi:NhaA family Na+:H+ antiporter